MTHASPLGLYVRPHCMMGKHSFTTLNNVFSRAKYGTIYLKFLANLFVLRRLTPLVSELYKMGRLLCLSNIPGKRSLHKPPLGFGLTDRQHDGCV